MTTKTNKAVFAAAAIAALFGAQGANAATATATAKAKILKQITVTKSSDLDFGTIVTGATASTVAVSAAGVATCGSGLTCTGTTTAAGFGVTGTTGEVVTISAAGPVSLTSGANTMSATLVASSATKTLTGVATTDAFTVGGTLAVGANQADGVYSGNFTVTVNYQ